MHDSLNIDYYYIQIHNLRSETWSKNNAYGIKF